MNAVKFLVSAILFSLLYHSSWQKDIPGSNQEYLSNINKTLQLSISNKRNLTGHWITLFSLNTTSPNLPSNWNTEFKQKSQEINGVQSLHVQGTFIVPPSESEAESITKPITDPFDKSANNLDSHKKPAGYTLFPGFGYYKLYNTSRVTFNEALNTCFNDGGHLAIINSDEEADLIRKLHAQYPTGSAWVYMGFHDRVKEGEYTTIFGQYVSATGYSKWASSEPSSTNVCGFFDTSLLLHVASCTSKNPFLCKIPA